jgi:hypothetical protein
VTWAQMKHAIEQAGVKDDEEISEIQCEDVNGDQSFQKVRLGVKLKLVENISNEKARSDAEGCAV